MSLFHRPSMQERFTEMASRYERMIYLLCLRMTGSREDAMDCAQETLLRAYRAYGSFHGRSGEKTWLYRIACNTCVDLLRRRPSHVSLEELQEKGYDPADTRIPLPGERLEKEELRRQILEALALLPEDQRAAVILRDFQQMSYEEIARILEISEGTVKSRLSRGREKIKNILIRAEQNGYASVKEDEGRQE